MYNPMNNRPNFRLFAAAAGFAALALSIPAARAASGSVTYNYDSNGRLVQSSYSTSHAETYSYDSANNRTSSSTR
jgi:YD repeat-containing protein